MSRGHLHESWFDSRPVARWAAICGAVLLSAGALAGCSAEVAPGPVAVDAYYGYDYYPHTYYQGRTVYFIDGRWGYPQGDRWNYYRQEPPGLAWHRTYIQQAPPAPRYAPGYYGNYRPAPGYDAPAYRGAPMYHGAPTYQGGPPYRGAPTYQGGPMYHGGAYGH